MTCRKPLTSSPLMPCTSKTTIYFNPTLLRSTPLKSRASPRPSPQKVRWKHVATTLMESPATVRHAHTLTPRRTLPGRAKPLALPQSPKNSLRSRRAHANSSSRTTVASSAKIATSLTIKRSWKKHVKPTLLAPWRPKTTSQKQCALKKLKKPVTHNKSQTLRCSKLPQTSKQNFGTPKGVFQGTLSHKTATQRSNIPNFVTHPFLTHQTFLMTSSRVTSRN